MDETWREQLSAYIKTQYGAEPERLWLRYPNYTVYRHCDNAKLFALVMDVPGKKLGLEREETVDILNVKLPDPMLADFLTQQPGYLRGYHISRGTWISILLDGSVPFEEVCQWLEESYLTTASKETQRVLCPPKVWLIPANPKYFDIEHAFDHARELLWKQGNGIRAGDVVYMYVAAPVSAILYRCEVKQTGIPLDRDPGQLRIRALMKLRLTRRYPPEQFPFSRLSTEYGVGAVRGPRGVPNALREALEQA